MQTRTRSLKSASVESQVESKKEASTAPEQLPFLELLYRTCSPSIPCLGQAMALQGGELGTMILERTAQGSLSVIDP